MFAEAGVTGPAQPLEGSSGVHALYANLDAEILLEGLGVEYEFRTDIEEVPQLHVQPCTDRGHAAARRTRWLDGVGRGPIAVTISPSSISLRGQRRSARRELREVSAPVQRALLRSQCSSSRAFRTADIEPAAVLDPAVLSLASRVVVEVDETAGRFGPASVSLRTVTGAEHALRLDSPPGTPSAPLSVADLLTKAKAGFVGAVIPMSASRADALIDAVNAFESCTDATALLPRQAHEPDLSSSSLPLEVYPS